MKLRQAVNAMCRACTYDPSDRGTAAQQIACCTDTRCPLHTVRPVNTKGIPLRLLEHWKLSPADLDCRARALVGEAGKFPADRQIGALPATDCSQNQHIETQAAHHG